MDTTKATQVALSLSLSLSPYRSLSLHNLPLSIISLSLSLSLSVCLSLCLSLSLSLSLQLCVTLSTSDLMDTTSGSGNDQLHISVAQRPFSLRLLVCPSLRHLSYDIVIPIPLQLG